MTALCRRIHVAQVVAILAAGARGALAAQPSCGVAVAGPDGTSLTNQTTVVECNKLMVTDCTTKLSAAAQSCPKACPIAAPDPIFSCFFQCVGTHRGACVDANRFTAFTDTTDHVCEACGVVGCETCKSQTVCEDCRRGFVLVENQCVFKLSNSLGLKVVFYVLLVLVLALVVFAVVWSNCKGSPPAAAQNLRSIIQARRHRHCCKVQDWNTDGSVRQRYPLCSMNVHKNMILGVGLPLFYNSFVFQMVVHSLCLGATWWVYNDSGLQKVLATTYEGSQGTPDLSVCRNSDYDVTDNIFKFAESNFAMLGALYAVLFLLSLAYGRFQKRHAEWFDSQNSTQEDYVLELAGFPKENVPLPNEGLLCKQLATCFRKIDPNIELYGVSVGYDYGHMQDGDHGVDAVLFRFMERLDVVAGLYHDEAYVEDVEEDGHEDMSRTRLLGATRDGRKTTMLEEEKRDKQIVAGWFSNSDNGPDKKIDKGPDKNIDNGPDKKIDNGSDKKIAKILTTGIVFCVFNKKAQNSIVREGLLKDPTLMASIIPDPKQLQVLHPLCEPQSIFWWHLGVSNAQFQIRLLRATLGIAAFIMAFGLVIFWPLSQYIIIPMSETGNAPQGDLMTVMGILLGNVNMLLCINIWNRANSAGFHDKCRMDRLIFLANSLLTLVNFIFQVCMCMSGMLKAAGVTIQDVWRMDSIKAIGAQHRIAGNIFNVLVPGAFPIGQLMFLIMGGAWPYLWNSFLMYLIYFWRALPDGMLNIFKAFLPWAPSGLEVYPQRNAEKGLESMEVGLAWDYANNILFPSVAMGLLFFASPSVWKLFAATLAWSAFCYCYYRYIHLRFNKAALYTTPYLDVAVNFLWGLPLSILAAAWAHWGVRCGRLPSQWFTLLAFVCSFALWAACYHFIIDPWNLKEDDFKEADEQKSYEDVQADTIYSYFNCNPIYVLKCHFTPELVGDHVQPVNGDGHVCYYEVGKDFWFFNEEQRRLAKEARLQNDFLEIETYLDMLMTCLERCLCKRRLEQAMKKPTLPPASRKTEAYDEAPSTGFLCCSKAARTIPKSSTRMGG